MENHHSPANGMTASNPINTDANTHAPLARNVFSTGYWRALCLRDLRTPLRQSGPHVCGSTAYADASGLIESERSYERRYWRS